MNVCIIGGGAAGMVGAVMASKSGAKVTILEQRDRIGRKLLATGNGRCNLSNADASLSHYHGMENEEAARSFARAVFSRFSFDDTLRFFHELGVLPRQKGGYYYPHSEQASAVLDALRFQLAERGVRIVNDCPVSGITKEKQDFLVRTEKGQFRADRVILAVGSKAGLPGSVSDGYHLATGLGHHLSAIVPALVPLVSEDKLFKPLAGIRCQGSIRILDVSGVRTATSTGELQLTSYGLSGIPTFQVSSLANRLLIANREVFAELNFLPEMKEAELAALLQNRREQLRERTAEEFMIGILHKHLGIFLMRQSKIPLQQRAGNFTAEDLDRLRSSIQCLRVPIYRSKPFSDAQICAGGVLLSEVRDTMESTLVQGLYLAGELLDVHGDCGGYNLQWAFSSGAVAGMLL